MNNLPIGLYTVTVRDSKGCTTTKTVTIAQPAQLSVIASAPAISCKGDDTTITTIGSGGIPGYTFTLNGASVTPQLAGVYTIEIKDANNCTALDTVALVEPALPVSLALSNFVNPGCGPNVNGGQFLATPTGGNGSYVYTSITAPGTITAAGAASNMTVGSYTVNVSDAKGCTASAAYTFAPVGLPSIILDSVRNVTCPGDQDGGIFFRIRKGVRIPTLAQITYSPTVSGALLGLLSDSSASITNLFANTYNITFTDSSSCIANLLSVPVDSPLALNLTLTADSVNCFGDSTGSIAVATTGGNIGAYEYQLAGPISRPYPAATPMNNLPIGTYTVTVRDSKGCTTTKTVTIAQPAQLSVIASAPAISCKGDDTTITTIGSGGIPGYTFTLNGASVIPQLAGVYTIQIRDANNCTALDTVALVEPALPVSLALSNFVNPGCGANVNSGTMTALATGGNTGTYTYASPGLLNAVPGAMTNAAAATYVVTATDSKGCTSTASHTFITPNAPTDTIVVTNASCNGVCDGTATASPTGFGPFTYAWSCPNNSSTSNVATGLCAGPCSVIITDVNGCVATVNFTVTQPAALAGLTISHINPTSSVVNNGSVTAANMTGGTAPYKYFLDSAGVTLAGPQTSPTFGGLHAGLYCISATDSNNCDTLRVCDTLTSPTILNCVAIAKPQDCFGSLVGSNITVITSGSVPNYTYSTSLLPVSGYISAGTDTAIYSPVAAGSYTFQVKAANGDSAVCSVTVNPVTVITPTITSVNPGCLNNNGSITVAAAGGTGIKNAQLFQGGLPVTSVSATTATFSTLASGTYQVVVTDSKNCAITNTVTLTLPTALVIDSASATAASCIPGSDGCIKFKVLNATGVLSVVINGGVPTYQSATSYNVCTYGVGSYNIVVTDTASKCSVLTTIVVPVSPKPTISITGQTPTNCVLPCNGTATASAINGVGPYTYSSNTGGFGASTTLTALCFGTNTIIVQDSKGCKDSATINIINANAPTLTVTAKTTPICYGDSNATVTFTTNADTIKYSGTAGNGILTNPIGTIISGLKPGTLLISAISTNGCIKDTTITIDTIAKMILTLGKTDPTCYGSANGVITTAITGGTGAITYTMVDSNGATFAVPASLNAIPAGCYTMTATDVTSCTTTASICLTAPDSISISVSNIVVPTCFGLCNGSANVSITGGTPVYTVTVTAPASATTIPVYNTTGNAIAITSLCNGTYTVNITDANNCVKTKMFIVSEPTAIVIDSIKIVDPTCAGNDGAVTVYASGGTGLKTTNIGSTTVTQGTQITGLSAGSILVSILDANNCLKDTTIVLANPVRPTLTIASQTATSCAPINGSVTLNVANANGPYTIAPATTGLAVGPTTFIVTDSLGCKDTVIATIVAKPNPTLTLGTIVTPNCAGDSNATVSFTSNGTVFITGTATTSITNVGAGIITGLEAGTFTLTAYNTDSCTTTVTGTILPTPVLTLTLAKVDVSINGLSDGSITATAGGGTPTYSYTINQNGNAVPGVVQTGNVFSSLAVGTYTIVTTDSKGCIKTATISITSPGQIVVKCDSVVKPTCAGGNDGIAYFSATNAVSPYTWSTTLAAPYTAGPTDSTFIRTGLTAGTYIVQARDANGAISTAQCIIIDTPAVKFDSVKFTNPTCNAAGGANGGNGTITVWMSGGTGIKTYTINGSAVIHADGTITSNLSGTQCYTITARDSKNCTATTTVCLTNPTLPTLSVTSTTPEGCNPAANGAATLAVANNNGSFAIAATPAQTGLIAGNYIYTVTDSLGCKDTALAIITKHPNPALTAVSFVPPNCFGDSNGVFTFSNPSGATISIIGGTALSTASGISGNTITDLKAGTIIIKATSIYGCDSTITFTITQPTAVVGTSTVYSVTIAGGQDGAITVVPSGGVGPYR
jgi:large repetitive protein